MSICKIEWIPTKTHKANSNVHKTYCDKVNFLNILQSPAYARSMGVLENLRPKTGLINIEGQPVGFVQILEISAFGKLFHALIIDRGPVWFEGQNTPENFKAFITTLKSLYPHRIGRKIRLIPEISDSPDIQSFLLENGYKHKSAPYQTALLNLQKDEEILRTDMKKKWRNALTKAEKQDLRIEWDDKGEHFIWLMKAYAHDKAQKGYDGPSVKLMSALYKTFTPSGDMLIGRALKNDKPIGAVLQFLHRPSATYQIGWTSQAGRDNNVHNLLLWDGIKQLKSRGIKTLDLGGMNDDSAQNIKKFKDGLGGQIITLPGLYTA